MQEQKLISKFRFPARPYQLKQVRFVVQNAMRNTVLPSADIDRVVLAVNEACMNIIQHGYKGNAPGEVFRLTDFVPPVDECNIKGRDWEDVRPGGLGVHFICESMDDIKYRHLPNGTGNILEMTKKLSKT